MNQFISVIICTYNRCESLCNTLDSLIRQKNIDFEYEIIIVDNNSKDNTKEILYSYIQKFKLKLKYFFEYQQGLSYARNIGIKEAKGSILIFTDDDCILDENWLSNINKCFQNYNCDGIGGRILPLYPENTPKWIIDNKDLLGGPIVMFDYGELNLAYDSKTMFPFVGANLSFKKNCFDEFGLFSTNLGAGSGALGEDTDFFKRLEKAGKKLYYCGEALAWHPVEIKRTNLRYLAKWYISGGKWIARDESRTINNNLVYCMGIPRYLIRDIIEDSIFLFFNVFNKRRFLKKWKELFCDIGKFIEYKENRCLK